MYMCVCIYGFVKFLFDMFGFVMFCNYIYIYIYMYNLNKYIYFTVV